MTIEDLHHECLKQVVGPLIFREIEKAALAAYKPLAARLLHDGIDQDDAVSSAMTFLVSEPNSGAMSPIREILLRDYSEMSAQGAPMTVALFKAMLRTTIRRHYLSLHPAGYVENLVDRAAGHLSNEPYVRVEWARTYRYFRADSLPSDPSEHPLPSVSQIALAVAEAMPIPKLRQKQRNDANDDPYATVRLSSVYGEKEFSVILNIITHHADGLSKSQLFEFFSALLTFYADGPLTRSVDQTDDKDTQRTSATSEPKSEDLDVLKARDCAEKTWASLNQLQRVIFRMRVEEMTDAAIATSALLTSHNGGVSLGRVSVLNMRTQMQEAIRSGFADLTEDEQLFAWNILIGKAFVDGN